MQISKYLKILIAFLAGFFTDTPNSPSMKRLCGFLCVIALCVTMYHNSFSDEHTAPSTILVESVALLAFGCLGLTATEKIAGIWKGNKEQKEESINEEN
jgi:hypothetical protein